VKKRERKIVKERDEKRERFFFEVFQQRMLQVFLSVNDKKAVESQINE
jgi:hypothetical protein